MKRFACIGLVICIIISLVACGRKETTIYSENTKNGLKKAIELVESYKKYDISIDELIDGLEEVHKRIESDNTCELNYLAELKMRIAITTVKVGKIDLGVLDCDDLIESFESSLYE